MNSGGAHGDSAPTGAAAFRTTHWSQVLAAGQLRRRDAAQALAFLCETYWYPLYAFIRRKGHSPEEAEDLTQEFFARLVEKNYVQRASREKGKFRTFLLSAVTHFLANEWDRSQTLKRGGGRALLSLDAQDAEARCELEQSRDLSPERFYDRKWATVLVQRALGRLQREYDAADKSALFQVLKEHLSGDREGEPYDQVAARLGITEGALKGAMFRARRRFGELLRAEVAETVSDPQEVDEELRYLISTVEIL